MALITTAQTGLWSDTATWNGGVKPAPGDEVQLDHTVYADENFDIGAGTNSSVYYAMTINAGGKFVCANRTSDASTNLTFTIEGNIDIQPGGQFYIGTEDNSLFGAFSVGPIPDTRTIDVYFSNDYYHRIRSYQWVSGSSRNIIEMWGAEDYHQATPDEASGQTVDSAVNNYSFSDAARAGDTTNLWTGAWLEITAGTNVGECREVTANAAGLISWSQDQPMPLPCDTTSVYTIKQCYHRALLTADANAASNTIVVDRAVDWEIGDELLVGCGAAYTSTTDRPERVEITGKTDSKTYTITLATGYGGPGNFAYNHKIGDFVVHLTKNITFSCNLGGSSQGYYFDHTTSGVDYTVKHIINWVFFDRCGYATSDLFDMPNPGADHPIINDITFFGYRDGSAVPTGYVFGLSGMNEADERTYMLENIHGGNMGGLYTGRFDPIQATSTLKDNMDRKKSRHWTLISMTNLNVGVFDVGNNAIVAQNIQNVWVSGVPFTSGSTRNGYLFDGNIFVIDGFKCFRMYGGLNLDCSTTASDSYQMAVSESNLRNGFFRNTDNDGFKIDETSVPRYVIENVEFTDMDLAGIYIRDAAGTEFVLINNQYDDCEYGLYLYGTGKTSGRVLEYGGAYGVTTPNNKGNVVRYVNNNDLAQYQYVSENTEYDTPTAPLITQAEFYKIFNFDSADAYYYRIGSLGVYSGLEAHNPTVDGTPVDSVGLHHCGSIVQISEHPSAPRSNPNIKLKVQPYVAIGPSYINFRIPFLTYATAGQTVTITVYVRKNITVPDGTRPMLHVSGNGIRELTDEMTDANDTWEQLSISYEVPQDGIVNAWLSCRNTYKHGVDSNTDDAEFGEPNDWGTVVVYFDELDITVT